MLGDQFLVALLDLENPTELENAKRVLTLARNKLVNGKDIEDDYIKRHGIDKERQKYKAKDKEKEIRALLYKMEEASIIHSEKKRVNGGYYVHWYYTYIDDDRRDAELMNDAIRSELQKVHKVKERFTEHDYMFYCEKRCSPKLYSYEQMYELEGKCAICGEGSLRMLSDEAKARSLKAFTFRLKPFIDKREVIMDLFSAVFPNAPEYLDEAMKELYEFTVEAEKIQRVMEFPPPISMDDALPLLSGITMEAFDDALLVDHHPIVIEQPDPGSVGNAGLVFDHGLLVDDVLDMTDDELMHECMRRWVIATKLVYDHLLELDSQRKSRLRSFTMKKFFFCDTMGKKYLSRALVGKPDKRVMTKLRAVFSLFHSNGYFKIQSYHPKFASKGVTRFMEMCEAGDVYWYDAYKEDILVALDSYMEYNKGSRGIIKKIKKKGKGRSPPLPRESTDGVHVAIQPRHRVKEVRPSFPTDGSPVHPVTATARHGDTVIGEVERVDF